MAIGRRVRSVVTALLVLVFLLAAAGAAIIWDRVLPKDNPAAVATDYGNGANWACLPGRQDSCAGSLDATAIGADGARTVIHVQRDPNPAIDCFYVYPTVAKDDTANATLALTGEVTRAVEAQFARFSAVCRPFAPIYRQATLRSILANSLNLGHFGDMDLAYGDVRDAWRRYLQNSNHGRGVVLIGHSQGARMIKRLLQEEIEGKPQQKLLVSALLLGNGVVVPAGKDVGGDFHSIPVCRASSQTGCVIAYSSYRENAPPPPDSRYGRDPAPGMQVACANPAALGGGLAVLDSWFPAYSRMSQVNLGGTAVVATPFVTVPGMIRGVCVHDAHGTYLSVSVTNVVDDRRARRIVGDVVVLGRVLRNWGLHLIDVNLTLGDLVKVVQAQGAAFTSAAAKPAGSP